MEIQSDLIILPSSNHLPLPWSVRGPLGLETGAEVSVALVHNDLSRNELPDILVTPLQVEHLTNTYTLDVELGERPGAVSAYLTWLGDFIAEKANNSVNIVLSETITLEGRNKHKMHIVLEPASDKIVTRDDLEGIVAEIKEIHPEDVLNYELSPIYASSDGLTFSLDHPISVEQGWVKYEDWKAKILESYPDIHDDYDLSRVVVSSNPDQRLLRYIIPKKGVIELRVPHRNRPGALKEICRVIGEENYNILSSRLSRTPPRGGTAAMSVFVAACEPMSLGADEETAHSRLKDRLKSIETKYSINSVYINRGQEAERTLFLTPRRREIVPIDYDIAIDRAMVRQEIGKKYFDQHGKAPKKYIFLSKRFISADNKLSHDEQSRCMNTIIRAIEDEGCASIEAANPGDDENRNYDLTVYKAVFSRLWASDACAVMALNENGTGVLSLSIAHEIGFFAGRNRPIKVFVTAERDTDPVFGNIVGMNRVTFADGEGGFVNESATSLYRRVRAWVRSICQPG